VTQERTRLERETRERLLDEAARLFAARGFARVTVRDICHAAGANVAAVNYHFHGKQGLYDAVVGVAISRMQQTTEAIVDAGRGRAADEQLTAFVRVFLERVVPQREGWIHQLMVRELADPTPALKLVVREVLEPRTRYLAGVVARLLSCRVDDVRVQRATMSVQWQCLAAIDTRLPDAAIAGDVATVAAHIATFSLGGIRSLTVMRPRPPRSRGTRPARQGPPARRP
jgi:TetR/AcrR family transcriptional regulator, regulator of cefoperazone and chloramphenicol sensitivity